MSLRLQTTKFGEVVKEERERRILTQREAAAELGVSVRALQDWETKDVMPHARHRRAIIAWLEQEV